MLTGSCDFAFRILISGVTHRDLLHQENLVTNLAHVSWLIALPPI